MREEGRGRDRERERERESDKLKSPARGGFTQMTC